MHHSCTQAAAGRVTGFELESPASQEVESVVTWVGSGNRPTGEADTHGGAQHIPGSERTNRWERRTPAGRASTRGRPWTRKCRGHMTGCQVQGRSRDTEPARNRTKTDQSHAPKASAMPRSQRRHDNRIRPSRSQNRLGEARLTARERWTEQIERSYQRVLPVSFV